MQADNAIDPVAVLYVPVGQFRQAVSIEDPVFGL